jgi:hypothetical protein
LHQKKKVTENPMSKTWRNDEEKDYKSLKMSRKKHKEQRRKRKEIFRAEKDEQ